jgi:hypothetical protein
MSPILNQLVARDILGSNIQQSDLFSATTINYAYKSLDTITETALRKTMTESGGGDYKVADIAFTKFISSKYPSAEGLLHYKLSLNTPVLSQTEVGEFLGTYAMVKDAAIHKMVDAIVMPNNYKFPGDDSRSLMQFFYAHSPLRYE